MRSELHRATASRRRPGVPAIAAIVLTTLLAGTAAGFAWWPRSSDRPRNVLLISIDTLRADRLSSYGYARNTTPFIDTIAAGGTQFDNTITQAPWTLPAHTSMLTGLYPHRHGVFEQSRKLSSTIPTLASLLTGLGMRTAAVVNCDWLSRRQGLDQGFASFERLSETGNRGEEVSAMGRTWLEDNGEHPFFLFLHYFDVHSSYTPSEEFRGLLVDDYTGWARGSTAELLAVRHGLLSYRSADVAHVSDLYDAEIRELDENLRGLFRRLRELDLIDDTLVIITSDHGEEFMEHGGVLHGRTMYDEITRVPLILAGPGVPRGRRVSELAMVVDIVPTILGLLGHAARTSFDGADLGAWMDDGHAAWGERHTFAAADWRNAEPDSRRMIRTSRHKMLYDRVSNHTELFDLKDDPHERTNIAGDHAVLVAELKAVMAERVTGEPPMSIIEARPSAEVERLRALGYFDE